MVSNPPLDYILEPALQTYLQGAARLAPAPEHIAVLDTLAGFIRKARDGGTPAGLAFLCTHNSRRSQMAQCAAQALAIYHNMPQMFCLSAGSQATDTHPEARAALGRAGFAIQQLDPWPNGSYWAGISPHSGVELYSKTVDQVTWPAWPIASIAVCSAAADACPIPPTATLRLALPFEDPRHADGTPAAPAAYDACLLQITTALVYAFRVALA